MRKRHLIILIFCNLLVINCYSQSFQNGDLEGVVTGFSGLPTDWQNVPFTDSNSLATLYNDTPDLTNLTGPLANLGYNGNPFSGSTFISGAFVRNINPPGFVQEGIMQTVTGLIVEHAYTIRFHQTVVKTIGALDQSGSWAVYIDTVLAGVTIPTHSDEPFNSNSLPWEARSIIFSATGTTHLIKFLPMDDDTNYFVSYTDTTGALYMGIDSIGFDIPTGISEVNRIGDFCLFPNPSNGSFHLQFHGDINSPLLLSITDVFGKLIDSKEIVNTTTEYENTSFSNGLYFYSLRQGIEEVRRGKFLIVK